MFTFFDSFTVVPGVMILRPEVWLGPQFALTCDQLPANYFRPWCAVVASDFPLLNGEQSRLSISEIRVSTRRFRGAIAASPFPTGGRRLGYYFYANSGAAGFTVNVYRYVP